MSVPKDWTGRNVSPQEIKQFLQGSDELHNGVVDVSRYVADRMAVALPVGTSWITIFNDWFDTKGWNQMPDYVQHHIVGQGGRNLSPSTAAAACFTFNLSCGVCIKSGHSINHTWFMEPDPITRLADGLDRIPNGPMVINQRWHHQVFLCKPHEIISCMTCKHKFEYLNIPVKYRKAKTEECPDCLSMKLVYSTQDVKAKEYFRKTFLSKRTALLKTLQAVVPPVLAAEPPPKLAKKVVQVNGQNVAQAWANIDANGIGNWAPAIGNINVIYGDAANNDF